MQRVSSQLVVTKESEIRELLRQLDGTTADGNLMGQTDDIMIPKSTQVTPHLSSDGQVEFDALGETAQDKSQEGHSRWIVEVKWRQKRLGKKELAKIIERGKPLRTRFWCVPQAGFTQEAVAFAQDHDVLLSTGEDLKQLRKTVE